MKNTRKIIYFIDVKVDENNEFEDKQPKNVSTNDPINNDDEVD